MTLEEAVARVRAALTDELRRPPWRGDPCPEAGHCYVAAEAVYHLLGGPSSGWVPVVLRVDGITHWYLRHREEGHVADPTAAQFAEPVPYHLGRPCGFLTRAPSKRAAALLARV